MTGDGGRCVRRGKSEGGFRARDRVFRVAPRDVQHSEYIYPKMKEQGSERKRKKIAMHECSRRGLSHSFEELLVM